MYSEHSWKVCYGVRAIISWHEFCDAGLSLAFVVPVAVFCGEYDKVTNLVDIFQHVVLVGMAGLSDFGSKKNILDLLHVKCNMCYGLVCSCLFSCGIAWERHNWGYDVGKLAGLQLEARETCRCIYHIHDGKLHLGKFGQPSLLVVVNMVSDGLVYGFVCLFTAAICLKVVEG